MHLLLLFSHPYGCLKFAFSSKLSHVLWSTLSTCDLYVGYLVCLRIEMFDHFCSSMFFLLDLSFVDTKLWDFKGQCKLLFNKLWYLVSFFFFLGLSLWCWWWIWRMNLEKSLFFFLSSCKENSISCNIFQWLSFKEKGWTPLIFMFLCCCLNKFQNNRKKSKRMFNNTCEDRRWLTTTSNYEQEIDVLLFGFARLKQKSTSF